MEAIFSTENRAQVRNAGQAIELADALNSTEFMLVWERRGRQKTAVYRRPERHGQWGTYSGVNSEWIPVDGNGHMIHGRDKEHG